MSDFAEDRVIVDSEAVGDSVGENPENVRVNDPEPLVPPDDGIVKGPDPAVWGEEHATTPPPPVLPAAVFSEVDEGSEIKGPDPAVWGEQPEV